MDKNKDYQKKTFLYIISSWKQKAPELNSRQMRISLRDFLFGFQDFLYCEHSKRMCFLVLIGQLLYEHIIGSLGKNLSLYLLIGV